MMPGAPRAHLILMQAELLFDILKSAFAAIALHLAKECEVECAFALRRVAKAVFDFGAIAFGADQEL